MFEAATRDSKESEWYIKIYTKMVGAHRVDQRDWTEEEATEHGLYSDTIKPFTPKPTPGAGEKLGIATVVDGRVVWPLVPKSAKELAAEELAAHKAELAACQCVINGACMMMPALDKLFEQGTLSLDTIDADFAEVYTKMKTLQADIDGAA